MDNFGTFSEQGVLGFERKLPGPIERVWAYLTESENRGQWLASGEMDLRVGGKVELNFYHQNLSPHQEPIPEKYKKHEDGSTMYGRITLIKKPRLLSYTWGEDSGSSSEVTFELTPENDDVILKLTHHRLGENRGILIGVAAGWHTHLGILENRLNDRTPEGFWKVHTKMEEAYGKKLES